LTIKAKRNCTNNRRSVKTHNFFILPDYQKTRQQSNGSTLPNVRLLNIELFLGREQYRVDENNVLLMPFAQLLAHDLTGMAIDSLISPQGKVLFFYSYIVNAAKFSVTWVTHLQN